VKKPFFARTTPWGTIQTGDLFDLLPAFEQRAIIAHEEGHVVHRHALKRLAWVVTLRAIFSPRKFLSMCEAQEFEADRYAVALGHRAGLISFLFRRKSHAQAPGYPEVSARLEALHG
jgi:Zn-dependent protease with chaperone function